MRSTGSRRVIEWASLWITLFRVRTAACSAGLISAKMNQMVRPWKKPSLHTSTYPVDFTKITQANKCMRWVFNVLNEPKPRLVRDSCVPLCSWCMTCPVTSGMNLKPSSIWIQSQNSRYSRTLCTMNARQATFRAVRKVLQKVITHVREMLRSILLKWLISTYLSVVRMILRWWRILKWSKSDHSQFC